MSSAILGDFRMSEEYTNKTFRYDRVLTQNARMDHSRPHSGKGAGLVTGTLSFFM